MGITAYGFNRYDVLPLVTGTTNTKVVTYAVIASLSLDLSQYLYSPTDPSLSVIFTASMFASSSTTVASAQLFDLASNAVIGSAVTVTGTTTTTVTLDVTTALKSLTQNRRIIEVQFKTNNQNSTLIAATLELTRTEVYV